MIFFVFIKKIRQNKKTNRKTWIRANDLNLTWKKVLGHSDLSFEAIMKNTIFKRFFILMSNKLLKTKDIYTQSLIDSPYQFPKQIVVWKIWKSLSKWVTKY